MANTLTGTPAAAAIYVQVREHAAALDAPPCLAAVSVGAQPDDLAYLRSIAQAAEGCGIAVRPVPLPADCAPEALTDTLRALSADGAVHGVLLLRPLPEALRAQEILDTLDARKDVDGMTTRSLGALVTGAAGFAPCTAEACMELLRAHGIDPAGRRVTIVGRSLVIGRPAALLLTRADATVTLCHRKTPDLPPAAGTPTFCLPRRARRGSSRRRACARGRSCSTRARPHCQTARCAATWRPRPRPSPSARPCPAASAA